MQQQFWYYLIGGISNDETGIVGNFYAYGQHCGSALKKALQVAQENGFLNPEASEAARLDNLEDFDLPDDLVWHSDAVLMGPTTYSYPVDLSDTQFIPPTGIIKSTEESELDYDLIKEGFVALKNAETGFYEFELVAAKNRIISTFVKAIGLLPQAESLQIRVLDHWENQQNVSLTSSSFKENQTITEFLLRNRLDTLENGFVDCIVCSNLGETQLILGEHKQIILITKDELLFQNFGISIMECGFSQTTELHSLEYAFYHWHYRPVGSLRRDEMLEMLANCGFETLAE